MNKEDTAITPAATAEVVDRNSTRALYEEALAESLVSDREAAKRVIAEQIRQVESARMVLAAAEAKLAKLLDKTPAEIAMMRSLR